MRTLTVAIAAFSILCNCILTPEEALEAAKNTKLPDQPNEGQPPPAGHKGVWTDSIGDTNVKYGYDPVNGIPKHNKHVSLNYAKHPENNQAFPVNQDSQPTKDTLRTAMIGNKPDDPGSGTTRDHKPPNVQKLTHPDPDPNTGRTRFLTNAERKERNTVMKLPTSESDKERNLLSNARTNALKAGNNGMIHIHADPKPPDSRPSSTGSELKSDPDIAKKKKPPRPKPPTPPPPSPRKTRSKTAAGGSSGQSGSSGTQAGSSGTQRGKQKPVQPPATPQKSSTKQNPATPRPRPAAAPGKPASRIPKPVAHSQAPSTPAPKAPKAPSTPSRIPVPSAKKSTSTISSLTSAVKKLKFKRDLSVAVRMARRELAVKRAVARRDLAVRRAVARIAARDLLMDEISDW